jgi:hypothetical protein
MSDVQPPSGANQTTRGIQARQPYIEIAELLAAGIVRMRLKGPPNIHATDSEVSLGFSANQRVNANPSHTQGVPQ